MSMEEPVRKRGVPRTPPMQYRSPARSDSLSPRPTRNRSRSPAHGRPRTPPSPPPDNRGDRDRYHRSSHRNNRDTDDGLHFSDYYRSRFGSQSPEEYQNLRVTNIDPNVSNEELLDTLEKMRRYGDLHIKVVNQRDPHGRIAYVNFERSQDARDARKGYLNKLVSALGKDLAVDPTGVVRDQEGRLISSNSTGPPRDMGGGGYRPPRDHYGDGYRGRGGYRGGRGDGGGGGYYRDRGDRYDDERGYRGDRR